MFNHNVRICYIRLREINIGNYNNQWSNNAIKIYPDPMLSFPWESVQICEPFFPLLRKDNCRSATIFKDVQGFSVHIVQEFFRGASGKQCIAFLGFFNKYFCWPRLSQLKISITRNSWEGKLVPIKPILVSGECLVQILHGNLSISLEFSRSCCSTLSG